MLCSTPCPCPLKFLIWPCGIVLTGRMHHYVSLNPVFKWMQIAPSEWSSSVFINERVPLLILKVLFGINQSFALCLCCSLWGKHGGHSSGFLHGILMVTFWLADTAWWLPTWNPLTFIKIIQKNHLKGNPKWSIIIASIDRKGEKNNNLTAVFQLIYCLAC